MALIGYFYLLFALLCFALLCFPLLLRVMRAAADLYSKSLIEFEEDYFTTDDAWARREARADLFSYLDSAREVQCSF